ncbi:hypothetical protein Sjap_011445 [Stephania japonica]|uniref:Uncharacterized protein n=1 Tax=Stephania japonica TaxID=461633 RepID=A0AAP0P515_9MAGN
MEKLGAVESVQDGRGHRRFEVGRRRLVVKVGHQSPRNMGESQMRGGRECSANERGRERCGGKSRREGQTWTKEAGRGEVRTERGGKGEERTQGLIVRRSRE